MHVQINNRQLYEDRTVQDWHRDRFSRRADAIDLDLFGVCHLGYCREPLYLIEATTNPNKPDSILRGLARKAGVPAFVVVHNQIAPTHARQIWPVPVGWMLEPDLAGLLKVLRSRHMARHRGSL